MYYLILLIGCVGATLLITSGSIFDRPREFVSSKSEFFGELVHCPMCTGFWVGLLSGLLLFGSTFLYSVYYGFTVSLASFIIGSIAQLINNVSYYFELKCEEGERNE